MSRTGWPYPRVLAHRGAGHLAPENTLAALRCGWLRGFRAVEFDVMLSADEVPVLMHDPVFGRTVRARGAVAATPASELVRLDAGRWFAPEFAGEPVPTLAAVLDYCHAHGIFMNIEIKPAPGHEKRTGQVVALHVAHYCEDAGGRAPAPLLSSFSATALTEARVYAPGVARGLLVGEVPHDWQAQLQDLQAQTLHCDHRPLDRGRVQAIKAHGVGLFCYTVNDVGRARELLDWGIDAFCTDRIDLIGPDFAA